MIPGVLFDEDVGMYFEMRAEGKSLTVAQAKTLDDEFFRSRPNSYFAARIAALLDAQRNSQVPSPESDQDFFTALGLQDAEGALDFTERERQLQIAVDAVALRHQAAEALVRFMHAVVAARPKNGDAPCTWLAVAEGPMNLVDVVREINSVASVTPARFGEEFFPVGVDASEHLAVAAETADAWIAHAIRLLTGDELSVNAAHNKVKHGLAVSARDDVRVELMLGEQPVVDGTIPLSAFGEGKSIPIFDKPMLTFLSRPPGQRTQGTEAISLRVDLPVVLTETWMMANIYSAYFHVAAAKHFGADVPADIAPYPRLVLGRMPADVIGGHCLGYRQPVTTPLDDSLDSRPAGLFIGGGFIPISIDINSKTSAIVIDDETNPTTSY